MAKSSMSPVGVSQTQHTECSTNNIPKETGELLKTSTSEGPTNDIETLTVSVQENGDNNSSVQKWSQALILGDQDDIKCKKRCEASFAPRLCKPRPFDKSCPTFEYTQNEILPPETGPSNLIDPVHEYKLMANTKNVSEDDVLKKFTSEVFRFSAGCINSRTNGTIHFGVGDEPLYKHGQIIGLEMTSPKKYIDEFDKCIKLYFTNHTGIVQRCVRPPQFFRVKCPDNINVDKWVIEVDVVPMYELTLDKRFYTPFDKKGRKSKTLFIRDGANTIDYMQGKNPKRTRQNEKDLKNDVKLWALSRKIAEKK
ncbi:sterile alpha motif domain-containing protein 9-like [Paramisgurnus dabryanus]|uniref:sterile alpha motif domain-containing protein 9-like n=1 Tax=Paramisgurnus dabryanus TaxID=90735 RepID=UPI0031F44A85